MREGRNVDVEMVDAPPSDVIDQVRSRRVDAGIVYSADTGYLARASASDLHVRRVRSDELVLVMPRGHPMHTHEIELAAVADDRWILPFTREGFPGLAELVREAWWEAGIAPPRSRSVATLQTALPLVEAGLGEAVMPKAVTRIGGSRVSIARVRGHLRPLEAALLWRRHEAPTPVLTRFLRTSLDDAAAEPPPPA